MTRGAVSPLSASSPAKQSLYAADDRCPCSWKSRGEVLLTKFPFRPWQRSELGILSLKSDDNHAAYEELYTAIPNNLMLSPLSPSTIH
ncbi:hypothetical protein MRB53_036955 [Persea americana]|nr:hypothetical protein MRB53_036955 [Persea americana]